MDISFPVLSLTDALDKLFTRQTGNLMRWAVADYEPAMVRNLALALSGGAIQASGVSRQLQVVTMGRDPGVVVDADCDCTKGKGSCSLAITPDGQGIYCTGTCSNCEIAVVIPAELLGVFAQ
jgi:hypothetical protein